MPGPELDLVGDEELAEVVEVIGSGRLSRCIDAYRTVVH